MTAKKPAGGAPIGKGTRPFGGRMLLGMGLGIHALVLFLFPTRSAHGSYTRSRLSFAHPTVCGLSPPGVPIPICRLGLVLPLPSAGPGALNTYGGSLMLSYSATFCMGTHATSKACLKSIFTLEEEEEPVVQRRTEEVADRAVDLKHKYSCGAYAHHIASTKSTICRVGCVSASGHTVIQSNPMKKHNNAGGGWGGAEGVQWAERKDGREGKRVKTHLDVDRERIQPIGDVCLGPVLCRYTTHQSGIRRIGGKGPLITCPSSTDNYVMGQLISAHRIQRGLWEKKWRWEKEGSSEKEETHDKALVKRKHEDELDAEELCERVAPHKLLVHEAKEDEEAVESAMLCTSNYQ
ncbi:hypothetical protein DFH07DRAFT_1018939 [Mycena maculata]|uniref:Uncharacterized protein n=1 Tax=Mycena maculata TaxID=230809 RepID=A0AAD7JDP0_9AGAR|nr:hypothetical protein DFH07DRAFT_1018939 [Mycena maculata]